MPLSAIKLSDLRKIGLGLNRPEDVVVGRDNRVWASDASSACAEILPDGGLRRVGRAGGQPNGINMDLEGRIVIANYESGPVQRLDTASGKVETLCTEVEGEPLTSSNYPILDRSGNIWCANSTRSNPWSQALDGRADGMLFRIRPDGRAEKMADGIRFANGLALDADESHIYVCETTGCDVLRYRIRSNGSLGPAERYGPVLGQAAPDLDPDQLPGPEESAHLGLTDGCGFDQEGNLWVTLVAANRIVAITPQGEVVEVVADPTGELMRLPTNVSWGGPDLRDLYIGSIGSDYVLHARSPVPGLPLLHQR
ncbi:MAG: SMP-30/gluconolactonase/LRE family protein [Deltaproteobacteria bacterium]|nr:SMP-30/gluconolactonase/LRE family protein [Deltaproteobacteria bacterium]TDJ02701.1 MAG: SMP-30/gluconolactonase/LRE family protein [Deltaproteobacteria bacterium]